MIGLSRRKPPVTAARRNLAALIAHPSMRDPVFRPESCTACARGLIAADRLLADGWTRS